MAITHKAPQRKESRGNCTILHLDLPRPDTGDTSGPRAKAITALHILTRVRDEAEVVGTRPPSRAAAELAPIQMKDKVGSDDQFLTAPQCIWECPRL